VLLAVESVGGLVILFARVAFGAMPGVALHVLAGVALSVVYTAYQITHWSRVAPWRSRPDYVLGLIAAVTLSATNVTGLVLGWFWWDSRLGGTGLARCPVGLSAAHTLGTMLVLAFAGAHLAAVLQRDRDAAARASGAGGRP